jgi:ApaG protein
VLEPGETHEYISGCNLKTGIGKMKGTYLMERVVDAKQFRVRIPEFTMIVPYRLN